MPVGAEYAQPDLHLALPRLVEIDFCAQGRAFSWLADPGLAAATGVKMAFTRRSGGVSSPPYSSLNLGAHVGDAAADVRDNRRLVLAALGAGSADGLAVPKQVHAAEIVDAAALAAACPADSVEADAVISHGGAAVMLCAADCALVVVAAPGGVFCVAHCGWRGTLAGLAAKALHAVADASGCDAACCNVYIGPHIGACCYEVDGELLDRFEVKFGGRVRHAGNLDLGAAIESSLVAAGAAPERIAHAGECTACNTAKYYSYRAEGGVCGRHGVCVWKEGS